MGYLSITFNHFQFLLPMFHSFQSLDLLPHFLTLFLGIFLINLFIYLVWFLKKIFLTFFFLAALGLCCSAWAFSSCDKWGLLFIVVCWFSHCGGFSCCGAWGLGLWASVVAACMLSSCGTQALECTDFSICSAWAQ